MHFIRNGEQIAGDPGGGKRLNYFLQMHLLIIHKSVELLNLCICPQQISQYQERFIQMLNEPVGEGGEAPEVGEMGAAGDEGAPVNYIQVTPQEKEAIERVSDTSVVFIIYSQFC